MVHILITGTRMCIICCTRDTPVLNLTRHLKLIYIYIPIPVPYLGVNLRLFSYIECTSIIPSLWVPQKELTGWADKYLVGLPSKTYAFEDKLTGCLSVRLVIFFNVGYCSICCVNKFCGANLDEQIVLAGRKMYIHSCSIVYFSFVAYNIYNRTSMARTPFEP